MSEKNEPGEDWYADARRRMAAMGPPKLPREWTVRLNAPEERDPYALDAEAIARSLAPDGWRVARAGFRSIRGATLAPTWRGWQLEILYVPAQWPGREFVRARWYLTDSAIAAYMLARGMPDDARVRATDDLESLVPDATYRESDSRRRELWRSPSHSRGRGLRWVIDPRPRPPDDRPRVLWVGYRRPPDSVWRD